MACSTPPQTLIFGPIFLSTAVHDRSHTAVTMGTRDLGRTKKRTHSPDVDEPRGWASFVDTIKKALEKECLVSLSSISNRN